MVIHFMIPIIFLVLSNQSTLQSIVIMSTNKIEEREECFLGHQTERLSFLVEEDLKIDIKRKINEQMPANELRTVRRPETMVPRTFFLETQFYQLDKALNQPCQQQLFSGEQGRLKLKIVNSKNLSLEEYFSKPKFRCIYNKLQGCREGKSFTGRVKGVDSFIDYNWKNFKQLQCQNDSKNQYSSDYLDSNFENGNLCRAYINNEENLEYYLLLQNDINTYGYNNWFFFRCKSKHKGIRRFTIVNFIKKTSFFGQGMHISIFSKSKFSNQGLKWFKGGSKITFSNINFLRMHHEYEYYSCLSFEYNFTQQQDEVYFALNQPYTYSRMVNFIQNIGQRQEGQNKHIKIKNIGYSMSNNIIPTIKILGEKQSKEIILIMARQHPCETTGSFVAEYLIRQLFQNSRQIKYLLQKFEFVVVPMVNPDGVIHGMSRCNMAGLDLNRQWGEDTIKELTPEITKVKQLIANLSKSKKIKYMIDLHGHGKKLGCFLFACKPDERENYRLLSMSMKKLQSRFSLCECTYGISKDKENTIRSVINNMGISHSYTLQTSLYGWKNPQGEIKHFNQRDYNQIAVNLLNSIFMIEAPQSMCMQLFQTNRQSLMNELGSLMEVMQKQQKINFDNDDILSDSDPEGDKLDVKDLICKCQNKMLRKKIQDLAKLKKSKRKKNRHESGRISSKNMKQPNPTVLEQPQRPVTQPSIPKQPPVKPESNKHSKKISFSEKWKVRRKQIVQRKKNQQKSSKLLAKQEHNITKVNIRSRFQSQVSTIDKKSTIYISSAKQGYSKKKTIPRKMKTDFKEVEDFSILSQDEIKQSHARKSALQLRFRQLKQQSLNIILTDTLSILKIVPNQKEKQKVPVYQHRSIKNIPQKMKTQGVNVQTSFKAVSKQETKIENDAVQETLRYKKFKQFLTTGGSPNKKIDNTQNSVFYYFPIL